MIADVQRVWFYISQTALNDLASDQALDQRSFADLLAKFQLDAVLAHRRLGFYRASAY